MATRPGPGRTARASLNTRRSRVARKREGALSLFADESGIRSDYHAGTTWAPAGKTPLVKATGARYGFNMLSAVSAQGHFRFMTLEGRVNAEVFASSCSG